MNIHPQIIKQNGRPAFVVLPIKDYANMLKSLEDIEDIQAIEDFRQNRTETFPLSIAEELADGVNSIKVFRQYRGMSQIELADKVGVSKQYISQLENGERDGTTKVLKNIATALNLTLDDLT